MPTERESTVAFLYDLSDLFKDCYPADNSEDVMDQTDNISLEELQELEEQNV